MCEIWKVEQFKYLSSIIIIDMRCTKQLMAVVYVAKIVLNKKGNVITDILMFYYKKELHLHRGLCNVCNLPL